jgi:hypothetical protein
VTGAWTAAFVVLSLATLVSIILQLGLVRRVSTVLEELAARNEAGGTTMQSGVPRGFQLSPFEIERADGSPMAFAWPSPSPSIFLFMEPGCAPCRKVAPTLAHVRDLRTVPLYVVTPHESADGWLPVSGDFVRLLDRDEAATSAFRNGVAPQAFAVDRHGVVRERKVVASADDLSFLASSVWEEVGEPIGN